MDIAVDSVAVLRRARSVLATEAAAIAAVESRVGAPLVAAVQTILNASGRVVVTGIGKSGHVGRKIAATLASTGTPAFFVHPAEASHGDMGMITADDVVIALSNSGEVAEVNALLTPIKRVGARIIAITGNENSTLGTEADITLDAGVSTEACPLGLAPTASTAAAMALGDALAMALLEARGFTAEDFARSHPGGSLGRRLLTHVRDVMRIGTAIPTVALDATVAQALFEITGKGMGMTAVVTPDGAVAGIFTDGDLRRCLPKVSDFSAAKVADFMTVKPVSIGPDELAVEALGKIIHRRSRSAIDALPELQYAGLTPGIFPFPEKVMHIGSLWGATISVEEIKGADTPGEAMEPAPKESPDDLDPEKVLLQFLSGDGMPEVKDKAVQSIASGHESGSAYLLKLAARRSLPLKARVAILDYLTRYAVNAQDKSMINKFYALRRSSAGDRQFVASIDLSLRLLGNAFGRAIATGGTVRYTRAVTTDGYEGLPKETDIITLKQKPYPEYSGADVRTNLKKALKYYHLDPAMAERMQRRVSELLNQPENRESPERNLIFAALGRLYPDKDFYVLKKQGQDAFAKPGYFTTTLRIVTASQRGKSWQIAALQRLWSLSYSEADLIRQIYLRDGKLLQQRMRL